MGTIVLTGANRGIGLELARVCASRGQEVVATCRRSSDALDALGVRVEKGVDVADEASVRALAARLEEVSIDVLIHNAGILEGDSLADLDYERVRRQLEVNALGPLRLTQVLLPRLARGSKIALITSRMGSIADNTSGGMYGYRMSKAALNMAGASLALDLRERGIAVAILHPGFVRTEMTRRHGNVDPPDAAAQLWARIEALSMQTTGTFWHANGEVLPW